MKRRKLLGLGLLVSVVVAVGLASAASAVWSPNFKSSEETVTLSADDTHTGSLYATGNQVTINGTVTGSLYCAGGTVTINGSVEGDVLCAGQKVTINGTVGQDVRTAGQFVDVEGTIDGSLTTFGQDVRIGNEAHIAGDVNGAAQQLTMHGTVRRDLAVGAQILSLDGVIEGNADVAVGQLQMAPDAAVAGNFNYTAQSEQPVDDSAVSGAVNYNPAPEDSGQGGRQSMFAGFGTLFLMAMAVSAFVVALTVPRFLQRSSEIFSRQMPLTALVGFATAFGGPVIVGLAFFSIILAPIGLALLFAWLAIVILSGIFFAYWVGSELLRSQENALIRMLGGSAVVLVLCMIPFINILTMFAALVIGSGMVVTTLTHGYKRPIYSLNNKSLTKKSAH